jgi:alpha-1,3-rhamnosyl/mannosyltransferase
MASGTPVLTSNNSALREIAGGYAHLVDPLDVEEIARAIAHCMSDQAHRDNLRKLGLRRSEAFQWSKTAEQTLAIYRQVLDS